MPAPAAKDIEKHQRQLSTLLKELEKTRQALAKKSGRQSSVQKQFRNTEQQIGVLAAKGRALSLEQQQLDDQMVALRAEQATLEKQRQQQQSLIADHLKKAYRVGKQNPVSLVLGSSSPAQIDRQLYYLEQINQARTELLQRYTNIITSKIRVAEEIEQKQQRINQNQQTLASQHQELLSLQQKRQKILSKLDSEIQSTRQHITRLSDDRDALQKLIDQMNDVLQQNPLDLPVDGNFYAIPGSFDQARGKLSWPVQGVRQNRFGKQRPGSELKWQGITIAARPGEPVRAIHPGRIIFADWFRGQGLLIIVDHGDGYWSLYGHNQSLLQNAGAFVDAGDAIATVGNSGGQDQSALYFEIRQNGVPQNPSAWCRKTG